MDKQDFAQIKRQQDRNSESSRGRKDGSAGTFGWHGLANERPLPPFGAMSVSMARQFNRRLLDERFPLGNEKPVKGLAGSSLNMLRPNSASSRVRQKKPRPPPSSEETIARETVSLLDKYVEVRRQRRRAVLQRKLAAAQRKATRGLRYHEQDKAKAAAREAEHVANQGLREWNLMDEYAEVVHVERERAKAEAAARAAAAAAAAARQLALQNQRSKPSRSRRMRRRMSRRTRSPAPGGGSHAATPTSFVLATDADTPRSHPSRGGTEAPSTSPSPRRMVKELKWSDQVAKPAAKRVDAAEDSPSSGPATPVPSNASEAREGAGSDADPGSAAEPAGEGTDEQLATGGSTPQATPSALRRGGAPRAQSAGGARGGRSGNDRRPPAHHGPESAPPGGAKPSKVGWSPLQDYIEARHPIAAYDRRHVGPFPTPLSQLKNSPCFSFGERPVPRRAFQDTPGPNHYSNVCSALDKLSKAHFSPAFSIRGRLPGYMDRLCESGPGANIGLSHAPVETKGGRTFGVRHRHLDPHINPEDPSSASYNPTHNSPFDPVMLKKERARTKKHPKLGIRLKSRRSIDAAIGTPIPPGPGTYVLPSAFGNPPERDAQQESFYEGAHSRRHQMQRPESSGQGGLFASMGGPLPGAGSKQRAEAQMASRSSRAKGGKGKGVGPKKKKKAQRVLTQAEKDEQYQAQQVELATYDAYKMYP